MLHKSMIFMAIAFASILLGVTQFAGVPIQIGKMLMSVFFIFSMISFIVCMVTSCKASSTLP